MSNSSHVTFSWPLFRNACVMSVVTIFGLFPNPTIHANAGPPSSNAGAVSTIRATKSISIGLGTDLPAWDLCWSDHALMLQEAIARKAIARMESTERSAYLVEIRNLHPFPRDWRDADLGKDLAGRPITRGQMAQVRDNYAIEVERALIEIATRIRASRPGVSVAFAGFTQFDRSWVESQLRLGRTEIPYRTLAGIQSDPARSYELDARSLLEVPESKDLDHAARVLSSPTDELDSDDTVGSLLDDADAPRGEFGGHSPVVGTPGQPSNGPAGSGNPIGAPIRGGGGGGGAGSTGMLSGSGSSVGTILLGGDGSEPQSPGGEVAGASDNGGAGISPSGGNEDAAAESGSESPDVGSESQPADAGGGSEEDPEEAGDGESPEDPPADDSVGDAAEPERILRPGPGFDDLWGTNIAPVGTAGDPGFDAKAIAHWNVVPYQTVSVGSFFVGVVAFHANEIDRVEISLEGGLPVVVTEMALNSRTGTYEYWAELSTEVLSASEIADGPIELRAVIFPSIAGRPRVLESLWLNSNARGSLAELELWCAPWGSNETGDGSYQNPFRQPYRALKYAEQAAAPGQGADGARVLLREGEYLWGDVNANFPPVTRDRWAVIRSAPGVSASLVIFSDVALAGFKTDRIAVSQVTFRFATPTTASGSQRSIWINECIFVGEGRTSGRVPYLNSHWPGGVFVTGSRGVGLRDGFLGARLVRDADLEDLGSDAFSGSDLVVNSRVSGISALGTDLHADVYQLYSHGSAISNKILFGVVAENVEAQGLFASNAVLVEDVAFVNVLIAKPWGDDPRGPSFSQFVSPMRHLVLRGVSLPNSTLLFRAEGMSDVSIRGSHFAYVAAIPFGSQGNCDFEDSWFESCHFTDPASRGQLGVDSSVGDPRLVDPAAGDFRLESNSPLGDRILAPWIPVDVLGEQRGCPSSVGAIE